MTQIGDSAYALTGRYPNGVDGWGFYIGGDTPHVWSDTELAALPGRYRLPIYTRSNPNGAGQAQTDAAAALAWARAHQQPTGTLIQLDFETAVNRDYVLTFDAVITAAGYKTVLYGSLSTVLQNPAPSGGYNVANWDGLDEDPSWTAKQYVDMGAYDLNDFSPTAPLWDTQAAAGPAAAPTPEVTDMPLVVRVSDGDNTIYILDGGVLSVWKDPASLEGTTGSSALTELDSITIDSATLAQWKIDFAPLAPVLGQLLTAIQALQGSGAPGTGASAAQVATAVLAAQGAADTAAAGTAGGAAKPTS